MSIKVEGAVTLLEVYDMPTSVAFYCNSLGFEIVGSAGPEPNFGWVWLRQNDAELMLNSMYEDDDERPPEQDPARRQSHGDICIYFGCRDVDGMYAALRSRGVSLQPPTIASYGMKQLYLSDPDGYGLCFQWKAE
jgi:catechol 2,3-dioxygenase-like lactoylglutathione lyase family enzyme